jgi:hypothetical protein
MRCGRVSRARVRGSWLLFWAQTRMLGSGLRISEFHRRLLVFGRGLERYVLVITEKEKDRHNRQMRSPNGHGSIIP